MEASRPVAPVEPAAVIEVQPLDAAPVALPEDVPYWPSPYDSVEFQPPPEVQTAPAPVLPLQELVQRVIAAPVQAVIAQVAPRTTGGATTDDIIGNARSL